MGGAREQPIERAITADYAAKEQTVLDSVRWHLDAGKQVATLENPPDRLKSFAVQLRPMLGCVGLRRDPAMRQFDSRFRLRRGNMDFNRITEGTTVYLRVHQPGALLIWAMACLQGDGDFNGDALETSNCTSELSSPSS